MTRPWPRMMKRTTAAKYLDLTGPEFDAEVAAGKLPLPIRLGREEHWSMTQLEDRLSELTGERGGDWRKRQPAYAA